MRKPTQRYSDIQARQLQKIQSLVTYASQNVPYYRKLFQQPGMQILPLRSLYDFEMLPLVEKPTIQQNWHAFLSDQFAEKELVIRFTSGSTGQPLKCAHSVAERLVLGRHMMRARMQWGVTFPARWLILGGAVRFASGLLQKHEQTMKGGEDFLMLSTLELSPAIAAEYVQKIQQFQPQWVYGMPTALAQMAAYAQQQDLQLHIPGLRLIETVGELLHDNQRQLIQSLFQVPPANQYASREVWGIGFECPHGQMHLLTENTYVEILRLDGQPAAIGEKGEVVVTGLNNRAQPFIRYRLGDIGVIYDEPCPCGNPNPSIRLTGGRVSEKIWGMEDRVGTLVFDSVVRAMCQRGLDNILQYRVVQRTANRFEAQVVPKGEWTNAHQEFFVHQTRKLLREETEVQIVLVDSIPPLPSGKAKSFLVDLAQEPLATYE